MAFTDTEIADHTALIEKLLWSRHRPSLHLRDKIREGQRFTGQSIEFFFVRPVFSCPGRHVEEPIAKVQYVRTRQVWRLFWKRADNRWHGYEPRREVASLELALRTIHEDAYHCFFG